MSEISVVIKEPGKFPVLKKVPNTLEALQGLVGGYIEVVTLASDLAVICDEEGRIKGKPQCCTVAGLDFVGAIVFAGIEEDEFSDLPMRPHDFKRMFKNLWEVC